MKKTSQNQNYPPSPMEPRFLSPSLLRPLILVILSIAIPLTTSLALKSEPRTKKPSKTSPSPQITPQNIPFFSLFPQPQPTQTQTPKQPETINKSAPNVPASQPATPQNPQPNNPIKNQTNRPHKLFSNSFTNNPKPETIIAQTNTTNPTQQTPKKIKQNPQSNPQSNPPSIPENRPIQLTLSDTIILALQNNRDIKNAYLNRLAETQELATEEGKFRPTFTPEIAINLNRNVFGIANNNNNQLSIGADISVKMPAGGEFSFGWVGAARNNYTNNFPTNTELARAEQNLKLQFTQPLMRGFGVEINRASIEIARIREQINIITLKSTLSDTITRVIFAYRTLQQAAERVKIETQFLELAKQRKAEFQILIEAGRQAPVDILPYEKAIADREGILLAAENNRQQAIANLLQILDIDREINILPTDSPTPEINLPEPKNIQQIALENNPNYLSSILDRDIFKLNLLLAEDNQRWNLDFNASYDGISNNATDTNQNLTVGITLSREFGNLSLKSDVERSKVNLLKAENTLKDNRANLEIEIQNQLRDINLKLKQIELAKNTTQLAEKQLDIEQQKLRLGRSTSREIVRFQDELIFAKNQELNAQIDYLNALTNLQKTLGTTLNTWNITIETP
ncbi:TolC family protein [Ancylothrix sp. C2]|uniref:TolC family protein n=1 Tax=Ancylothrix sp. D3o TaxID=2953691 RepID=UPI0021BA5A98|nr:TolC family protein [Ancylothrix sp. D3o]MCT7948748.1 TolC family protein [Ancylothrix sp. D3o]